ncbi:hypothetical protein GCM10020366_08960 [Saccharopolyspora gregorii]|uniref:HTH cro/C1-type domain-containing protein n=1 Tax=Saccharopolyspora gregorii TaxID=33914 RepID=A0ABP6RKH4_9PSEU
MNTDTTVDPVHPGEILNEEFMQPLGISQYRLAKDIGVPARRINEIVHGDRDITANTALRLARYLGTAKGSSSTSRSTTTWRSRRTGSGKNSTGSRRSPTSADDKAKPRSAFRGERGGLHFCVRGAYDGYPAMNRPRPGPSPRARGLPGRDRPAGPAGGPIPACAGLLRTALDAVGRRGPIPACVGITLFELGGLGGDVLVFVWWGRVGVSGRRCRS